MAINSDFRGFVAESAVPQYSIVKPGVALKACTLATAATDKLLGSSDDLAHAIGEMVDVAVGPVPKVVLGGTVAVGDALTANGSGAAITTTTTGNRIIGFAEVAGVVGDVITYLRAPGVL
jgi:hypothetical protein